MYPKKDGQRSVYVAKPPRARPGHWAGYYVEVSFASAQLHRDEYRFTTPGYVRRASCILTRIITHGLGTRARVLRGH